MDQPVYVRDVDNRFPADPEESESEDEDILHDLNLNSGEGATYKRSITTHLIYNG